MIAVNTHEAKSRLSSLIADVEKNGEVVWICRNGNPVARLVAIERQPEDPFRVNPKLKPIEIKGDLCAPIDEKDWPTEWR